MKIKRVLDAFKYNNHDEYFFYFFFLLKSDQELKPHNYERERSINIC